MVSGGRLTASLAVALTLLGVSCLVFDGRVATSPDASDAPPGMDAALEGGDGAPGKDADEDRGSRGEGGGVICGPSPDPPCPGGPDEACCAWSIKDGPWSYPAGSRCRGDCSGAPHGFYKYQCDESDDCAPGSICCANPAASSLTEFTYSHCVSGTDCDHEGSVELCQPPHGSCIHGACVEAGNKYLPPGYYWCRDE
jgi:hypothetical protein